MRNATRLGLPLLLFMLITLSSCRVMNRLVGGGQLGTETQLRGTGYLVCSDQCFNARQCGKQQGTNNYFVFVDANDPSTKAHTNLASINSAVEIIESRAESIEFPSRPERGRAQLEFYKVKTLGQDAWVAGYCLSSAPLN